MSADGVLKPWRVTVADRAGATVTHTRWAISAEMARTGYLTTVPLAAVLSVEPADA